jgi:hypothetical protein
MHLALKSVEMTVSQGADMLNERVDFIPKVYPPQLRMYSSTNIMLHIHYSFQLSSSIHFAFFFAHLEKLPLLASLDAAVFENRLNTLMIIMRDVARNRSIECIKTVALDLRHDPKEADAKSASGESPQKASKRRGYESA